MTASAVDALEYDPFARVEETELHPLFDWMREQPTLPRTRAGWWVVSRFEHARYVLAHPEMFSSAPNQDELAGLSTQLDADSDPEHLERLFAIIADLPVDVGELVSARMIIGADPPTHTRLRSIVNRGFTPRRIDAIQSAVQRAVDDLVADLADRPSFDLVSGLAAHLPARVLASMLGVPPERAEDMKRWADVLSTTVQGTSRASADEVQLQMVAMLKEFADYFVPIIEERRRHSGDDLISALVRAEETETLSAVETVMFILVLVYAGSETAANLITNTVVALYENPEQFRLLQERPELIPNAIDESLRCRAPFQFTIRQALSDTTVGDTAIGEGDLVIVLFAAANRDPRQFDHPERFDVTREAQHLSLGYGIHYCLGAHLGRMEARIALTELLPHLARRRLDLSTLQRNDTAFIYGYQSAQLVLEQS